VAALAVTRTYILDGDHRRKKLMAETRGGARSNERGSVTLRFEDWKHLASVAGLLVVVVGALTMAAVLQRGQGDRTMVETETAEQGGTEVNRAGLSGSAVPPPPAPVADLTDVTGAPAEELGSLLGLAGRTGTDLQRLLAGDGDSWMLQIAAHCDPANVERLIERIDDQRLHVLPVEIDERACFRICWGPFDSRAAAEAATARLPALLRPPTDPPRPRRVADLAP
jgi:hypothetical protein